MRIGLLAGSLACLISSAANADGAVDIDRSVYVERAGERGRSLEPATTLRKGDKVVLMVEWRAAPGARSFTVESAVPRPLAFQRSGSEAVEVSADGGRSWGRLGALKIGQRTATAEDVTHLRLRVDPRAARGRLAYSAIVR